MRDSVIIYTSISEVLDLLTDEQKGQLFQAIIDYQLDREVKLDGLLKAVFVQVKQQIDMNNEKYETVKEKRSQAGKKGMEKRWAKNNTDKKEEPEPKQEVTSDNTDITNDNKHNVYDNVYVYDNVKDKDNINYQLIADMYNATCVSFPKVQALSDARKKAIKARYTKYTTEDFKRLFELAEGSDFLKGGNDRNWQATFDWLIKDANMAKVLDGNYTNKKKTQKKQTKFNNFTGRSYDQSVYLGIIET